MTRVYIDSTALQHAADTYDQVSGALREARQIISSAMPPLPPQLAALQDECLHVASQLSHVADDLGDFARWLREKVREAEQAEQAAGLAVHSVLSFLGPAWAFFGRSDPSAAFDQVRL